MGELKQLGRHTIVRVLGRGATSVVYEALDRQHHRAVAIKAVSKSAMIAEAQAADFPARFLRAVRSVAELSHPNIVSVYDFGEEGDIVYVVMELVHGQELQQYLDRDELFPLPDVLGYMVQLLSALEYVHSRGIIHCDVKPANIMIDSSGRLKLGDFGLARLLHDPDSMQAQPLGGTPFYMSPEQILHAAVSPRSDIFAAGVVFYQLLTRRKPFIGEDVFGIQHKIVNEEHVPPSSVNKSLPKFLDRIVNKALAKNPEQRYARAGEFCDDVQRVLSREAMRTPGNEPRTTARKQGGAGKSQCRAGNKSAKAGKAVKAGKAGQHAR